MVRLFALAVVLMLGVGVALFTIDSFLLDPGLLFVSGFAMRLIQDLALTPRGRPRSIAMIVELATIALYWSVSISLYFNLAWIDFLAKGCGAPNGRDWMINSGVFHFDSADPGAMGHVIAVALFATYPLWLWLGDRAGTRVARRIRGA